MLLKPFQYDEVPTYDHTSSRGSDNLVSNPLARRTISFEERQEAKTNDNQYPSEKVGGPIFVLDLHHDAGGILQ